MPLINGKSQKSVGKNISTEMNAGKPHDQAVAIALSVQRKSKAKKMSAGGEVDSDGMDDYMDATSIVKAMMAKKRKSEAPEDSDILDDASMLQDDSELPPEDDEMFSNDDKESEVKPDKKSRLNEILRHVLSMKSKK